MVPHPVQGQAVRSSASEEHLDSWWRRKGTKGGSRHHASGYGHDATRYDAASNDGWTTHDGSECLHYGLWPATYDAARYDAARYDAATYDATRYDVAANDAARYDATTRHDATRHADVSDVTARHDAARYAATRHDATAQHDAATRYDATTRHGPSADAATRNDAAPTTVRPDAPSSSGLDATPAIRPVASVGPIWLVGLHVNTQLTHTRVLIDWLM